MTMGWQHICTFTFQTEYYHTRWCRHALDTHEDDVLLLYKSNIALIIEDAAGLPPFLPMLVINGKSIAASSSFDSAAETKPTGIPMIRAGFVIPCLTMLITSLRAVGALPIATMPRSISLAACRMAISDLVRLDLRASSVTLLLDI